MDVSNFGCDERFYLLFTLLNSIETWNLRKKNNYTMYHWDLLGTFSLLTFSYFISNFNSVQIMYVYLIFSH